MPNVPTLGYAAGTVLPTYGYGASTLSMSPMTDVLTGGAEYIVSGVLDTNDAYADAFPGTSLSSHWTDVSSGGSIVVSNGLTAGVPTSGGTAAIRTVDQYKNFDVTTLVAYDSSIEVVHPTALITYAYVSARVSSDTYATVAIELDPANGLVASTYISTNGSVFKRTIRSTSASKSLRIVRFGSRVQAWVGSALLVDYVGWSASDVNMEIGTSSQASIARPLALTVSAYTPALLVTFGDVIAQSSRMSNSRLGGIIPPNTLPVNVDVQVHTVYSSIGVDGQFQYTEADQLSVSERDGAIVVTNDIVLHRR